MANMETPAGVASRTGAGEARCENVPDLIKNHAKRTASQRFAEGQLLAAIEAHDGRVYIMATDWGTWRDKWFISPSRAAEAASRLAEVGIVRITRRPGMIIAARAGQ